MSGSRVTCVKVKGLGHMRIPKKGRWAHNNVKLLHVFNMFFIRKVHDWRTILGHVGGENKKKAESLIFFSCRTSFQHIGGLVNRRI